VLLQKLFEGEEIDIALEYGWILGVVFTAMFYTFLIPIAPVYSLIALITTYWCKKYRFIKRCKKMGEV